MEQTKPTIRIIREAQEAKLGTAEKPELYALFQYNPDTGVVQDRWNDFEGGRRAAAMELRGYPAPHVLVIKRVQEKVPGTPETPADPGEVQITCTVRQAEVLRTILGCTSGDNAECWALFRQFAEHFGFVRGIITDDVLRVDNKK